MISRTTAWRRRKFGTPADGRGRHCNDERGERLAFVGAVVAQLIATGSATHHGLKTVSQRVPSDREIVLKHELTLLMTYGDLTSHKARIECLLAELNTESLKADYGDVRVAWVRPTGAVWQEIQDFEGNADCLSLAVVEGLVRIWHLRYAVRHKTLRGVAHSDYAARRNSILQTSEETSEETSEGMGGGPAPSKCPWQAIEGMNRKTAHYWKRQRSADFQSAGRWFVELLKKHNALPTVENDLSGMLRDDLADALAGKRLKVPKTELSAPLRVDKLNENTFAPSNKASR